MVNRKMNVHDYFKMYNDLGANEMLSAQEKFEIIEAAWNKDHGSYKLLNLNTFFSCRTRYIKKQIELMRS
jgi:hypothetical protein